MTPTVNRQIAEEAAEWIVAVEDGPLSARDRRALVAWLSRSPDHVGEFFYAATLLQAVGDQPEDRAAALQAVLGEKAGDVVTRMDTGPGAVPTPPRQDGVLEVLLAAGKHGDHVARIVFVKAPCGSTNSCNIPSGLPSSLNRNEWSCSAFMYRKPW